MKSNTLKDGIQYTEISLIISDCYTRKLFKKSLDSMAVVRDFDLL